MLQLTPQMRILLAVAPADFRKGIDGLARLCQDALRGDPFSGTVFVFRNRAGTSVKVLVYDGQGFWLAHKRLSQGRFRWWPPGRGEPSAPLDAHELQVLLWNGDPSGARAAPMWRRVGIERRDEKTEKS
jgi:transposase